MQNVNNKTLFSFKNTKESLFRGSFCLRKYFLMVFLCTSLFLVSQEKLIKSRSFDSNEIEIITDGLDDIVIENATNNQIEVILFDQHPNTHAISFNEEIEGTLKVSFQLVFDTYQKQVFRKYITKRLQKVNAILKLPKNKEVIIDGKTIGIISKSYQGNMKIYIDKGNVRLNNVKGNTFVSLFVGNVYAHLPKKSNIDIKSNTGIIRINNKSYKDKMYMKTTQKSVANLKVHTINANVILITE